MSGEEWARAGYQEMGLERGAGPRPLDLTQELWVVFRWSLHHTFVFTKLLQHYCYGKRRTMYVAIRRLKA